tara:strand:+ start:324 stop:818 length:495 start_codon:yes stop_codon:yes gene_type:complete
MGSNNVINPSPPNWYANVEQEIEELESVVKSGGQPHNEYMETVSRPELDAKLETIEAKMDGRVARIESSVQRIVDMAAEIKGENRDIRKSISSLKTTAVVVAISSVIAIVFGVVAFNATLLNNMIASHGSGKEVGAALEQARSQAASTQQLLEQIRQERQQAGN